MDKYARLREGLKRLCANNGGDYFWQAKVVAVEGDLCSVLIDDLEISDVRLRSVSSDDIDGSLLVTPAIGSMVVVGSLSGDLRELVVLSSDKFEEVRLGGDDFGGIVKVTELVEKLNKIETDVNALKDVFASWMPTPQDGGAALKSSIATWAGNKLPKSLQEDLENTKIVH